MGDPLPFQFGEPGTNFVGADQFAALRAGVALVNLVSNLGAIRGQPGFLFVEHGNRLLYKFVDGFVGAALDVLFNQLLEFGPKADFHGGILAHAALPSRS